jgi:uracil-DNA glycosylase
MSRTLQVLQAEIHVCRKCEIAGYIPEARPLTAGSQSARFMVIGQAPSRTDHLSGQFFVGPAGRRLREWFLEAGFAPEDFGSVIYSAAITKCFPGRVSGSSKDRAPSRAEQNLCRPWLDAEMAAVDPRVVVLFGGLAIGTFLSKRPLAELIGQTFEREGRLWIPLPHSSGASTWLNAAAHKTLLADAIVQLKTVRLEVTGQ